MKIEVSENPRRVMFSETGDNGVVSSLVELILLPDVFGSKPCAYIHKVYTDKNHQNKGLATRLLEDVVRYAKKSGCHKVFLITRLDNVKFYEKMGFEADQCGLVLRLE